MNKDDVTSKQTIYIITLFLMGSALVVGIDTKLSQDSWLAMIAATVFIIPVILIYSRISALNPKKDIFDIMQDIYKPIIGKFLIFFMIIYPILLGSTVTNEIVGFLKITSLVSTPAIAVTVAFMIVVIYLGLSGIKTISKGAALFLYWIIFIIIFTYFMSAGRMHINHLLPIAADHSLSEILGRGYKILNIPLAEVVLFLAFADYWKFDKKNNPYKSFFWGVFIAAFIMLAILLRNILVLGPEMEHYSLFPSFQAVRLVGIKGFLERIEGAVIYNFIIAGIAKVTVCVIAASKGMAKLFGTKNYKFYIVPVGFLIMALSLIMMSGSVESSIFLETGKFWMMPFLFVIPLIVWIGSEIKTRIKKSKESSSQIQSE
ncbi:MAG: endospore germination permease [Eubacteriaceae bacterium]|nr:endospore germination permease [Eubacteriaceae bacterium]